MKTLNDVLESGGQIDIYYHDLPSIEEAQNKLKLFSNLGEIKKEKGEKHKWLVAENDEVRVVAFYEKEVLQHA